MASAICSSNGLHFQEKIPGIIHYCQAAGYTPRDFEFARGGIQAEADPNVEFPLIAGLGISDLYRSSKAGSVIPLIDRRKDLFEIKVSLGDSVPNTLGDFNGHGF